MSPVVGGGAETPRIESDAPIWWGNRWGMPPGTGGGAGLPGSREAQPERLLTLSPTVFDNVVPAVYGSCTQTGVIGAFFATTNQEFVTLGIVFAHGEQDSITNIRVNGVLASTVGWVSTLSTPHVGDGSTAISSLLTGLSGWTAAETTTWKGLAHVAMRINTQLASLPGSLTVTAELGGQLVTGWDSVESATTNPVRVAYDIVANSSHWLGISSAKVHTSSWSEVADYADNTISDSTDRYLWTGPIYQRDPLAALREVLGHAMADYYVDPEGLIRLWGEQPPAAITGTWSASGTTFTEDSTAGSATTELSAGDWFWDGTAWRVVASVTSDDEFETTAASTASSIKVRPISTINVKSHNWVALPVGAEPKAASIPYGIRGRYTTKDGDVSGYTKTTTNGTDTGKYLEITYSGAIHASQVHRLNMIQLKTLQLCRRSWSGVADAAVAELHPGMVFRFSDDTFTDKVVRCTSVTDNTDGTYGVSFREYNATVFGDVFASQPSHTTKGGTWGGVTPAAPTGVTEEFVFSGGWGDHNLLPDPDDLDDDTTAWTWSSAQVVYDAVNDWTRIFTLGVDTYTGKLAISPTGNRIRGVMFAKWHADPSYPGSLSDIEITYYAGADAGSATKQGATYALDWCHEEWRPTLLDWEVAAAAYHEIRITCTPFDTGEPDWDVRRCFVVDDTADPTLELSRRIGWTEDGDASTEVAEYQLTQSLSIGGAVQRIAGVPSGSASLEVSLLRPSLLRGDTARDSMLRGRVAMRVASADGVTTVDFPTVDLADQSFVAVDARVAVTTLADTAGAGVLGALSAGAVSLLSAANLRTLLGEAGGAHTITAGEASNGTLDITTGLSSISRHLVQIYSSGELIVMAYAVSASSGTLTVADGAAESDYNITAGDIVHWQVWGTA